MLDFKDEKGHKVYEGRINDMCANNRMSIEVDFNHMTSKCATLAYWVFEAPGLILKHFNIVVYNLACKYYPGYGDIQQEVFVKIKDFPLGEELRELRTYHLNTLVKIEGVVTRRHPVASQLKKVYYICKCGYREGPIYITEGEQAHIGTCFRCQAKPPFAIDSEETKYRNYQKITVQESPGAVPPGRVPRYKDIILLADNIDSAKPGDEVEITGTYAYLFEYLMHKKHGFPIFGTHIEANNIHVKQEKELETIDENDIAKILEVSKDSRIFERICNSIAPSIFGHRHIKKAMALALVGGTPTLRENHRIRGDVNVLMIGDPGLAKSQFLKYVQTVSHRSIYTTGKGASAVGLTASVRKDPSSGEWILEGGAMVLADTGICLIDEFDKMSDQDRTSIHEAMEQQSISVSKAGIVANLQARCSVIAAANPVKGRYDNQYSFMDNVNLSEPIISRFDVICILRDEVDFAEDSRIANFIIKSHRKSTPETIIKKKKDENAVPPPPSTDQHFSQAFLKKYIAYARKHFRPELTEDLKERLTTFYTRLRQEASKISGLSIVVRHFESLIRFAQASAKLHLRNVVTHADLDIGIEVLLESFIQTQKPANQKTLRANFSAELKSSRDSLMILSNLLNEMVKENLLVQKSIRPNEDKIVVKIGIEKFKNRAKDYHILNVNEYLNSQIFLNNYLLKDNEIIKEF